MILYRLLVAGSDGRKFIFKDQPPDVGPRSAITSGLFQGFSLLLSKADTDSLVEFAALTRTPIKKYCSN